MNGYQLSFFTVQNQMHGRQTMVDWLVQTAKEMGLRGATVIPASQGIGRGGQVHSAHFFELADQPLEVIMAVSHEESNKLFDRLKAEGARLFYVRIPVEFGTLGEDEPKQP